MRLEDALSDLEFLNRLPGRKLIGKGNHDFWWTTASKMKAFFAEHGLSSLHILYNNAYLPKDGFCAVRAAGFWMNVNRTRSERRTMPALRNAKLSGYG